MAVDIRDIGIYFVVLTVSVVLNYSFHFMPWNFFGLMFAVISVVVFYGYIDMGGFDRLNSLNRGRELNIEPINAPEHINSEVAHVDPYKQMDLEKTGKSSTKIHVDSQEVEIKGELNFMLGIIAKPRQSHTQEYVAYIWDLTADRLIKYDSQRYSAGERLQPFKGKYSWLTARGKEDGRFIDDEEKESKVQVNVGNNSGRGESSS